MQQYRSQLKANISKPKPKTRILTDLTSFITQWRSTNEHSGIIVMMDANSDKEDESFNQFLADTALNDIIPYFQPNLETQSTYRRGQKHLDYILVSDEVLRASTSAGHTSYGYPFISDHRGVYMDLSIDRLFGSHLLNPTTPTERKLQLDRPDTKNNISSTS